MKFLMEMRAGCSSVEVFTYGDVGARCSSVVRAFAHGAMGRRIDSSCSTTGVTKAMVCAILSVGWCI